MGSVLDEDRNIFPSSSASSIDSNTDTAYVRQYYSNSESMSVASCSSSSRSSNTRHSNYYSSMDLSTDLKLGLSISSSLSHHPHDLPSSPRGQYSDWPPIKPLLRSTLAGKSNSRQEDSLFIKVYMEGIPIGRKLDMLAHDSYHSLITTLCQMFRTTILFPEVLCRNPLERYHILTHEDKEGDWMMVGDVPWEMFLTTVKRLKIATLDTCQ